MPSEQKHLSVSNSLNSNPELTIVDTFWGTILRERDALIKEGNNAFDQKHYIKRNVISFGIFLSTAGIDILMKNTGFLVKAMEGCQILANNFRDIEGPFADVCKILAGQLDNLAMHFNKMIRILGFIAATIEEQAYDLSKLKDQYLDLKEPMILEEFQGFRKLCRTPQAQTHWQTVDGILSSSIMGLGKGVAMSIRIERITTATLDLLLIKLKPVIERLVKESVRIKVIQESQLRSMKRRDIDEKLPLLCETNLYEDTQDVLKEIVLGVMRHSREWRIQLLTLLLESMLALRAIYACTDQLFDNFFISLPALEEYSDTDVYSIEELTSLISGPISQIVYRKILSLAGKAVAIIPQVLYRKYQENEERLRDQKEIELVVQRLDDVAVASRRAAATNHRCVHDAVAEILGVNSEQLADASGLGASEHGASKTDIQRLYAENGIKTQLCSLEQIFSVLQTQQSDRGVACFKGPDGMGHAVALYYKGGELIVNDQGREITLDEYKKQYDYSSVELIIPKDVCVNTLSKIQEVIALNRIMRATEPMTSVDENRDEDSNFGGPKPKKKKDKQEKNTTGDPIYIDKKAIPTKAKKREIIAILEQEEWELPSSSSSKEKNLDEDNAFRCDNAISKNGYEIQKNSMDGDTTIAVVHYPKELWQVVDKAPYPINKELYKEVHDIIKQKLIESLNLSEKFDLEMDAFPNVFAYQNQPKKDIEQPKKGQKKSKKHHGVTTLTAFRATQMDYWLDYSKKALIHLLELRLKASLISPENVIVMPPCVIDSHLENINFPQQLSELLAKIVQYCNRQDDSQILLLPLLIQQSEGVYHWVGIVVEKQETCITFSYLDSENQAVSTGFQEALTQGLEVAYPEYQIQFFQWIVESQRYNNCGSELIENFIQYLNGTRVSQEEAIELHQILGLQDLLLQSCDSEASFPNVVDSRECTLPEDEEEEAYALACVDASLSSEKASNARVFPVFADSLYSFFSAYKKSTIAFAKSETPGLYNNSP